MSNFTDFTKAMGKVYRYSINSSDSLSLLELVLATVGVLVSLLVIFCLLALCMKQSDRKLRSYVLDLAEKRGLEVDLDKIDPRIDPDRTCHTPVNNDNCAVYVPGVAIII